MSWISLVCLLALSSSALARSTYGSGYGSAPAPAFDQTFRRSFTTPVLPLPKTNSYGYDAPTLTPTLPVTPQEPMVSGYGSQTLPKVLDPMPITQGYGGQSYGASIQRPSFDTTFVQPAPVLTPADILCRGRLADTVIPLEGGRRFVVCIDESKGFEQECPKGLIYHEELRRCERKLGPLDDACVSQPCLNGGQCFRDGSSFQCRCATGFDGKFCELDARICHTQQPCGQAPDTRCQSFRFGAALSYVCIFQDGFAYGFSTGDVKSSPCRNIDGPHALLNNDKGFIMCDGERMFVESCPGGTIWDDVNKACTWPDMQGIIAVRPSDPEQMSSYGSSYGQTRVITPKVFNSYGAAPAEPLPVQPTYGGQSRLISHKVFNSYGAAPAEPLPVPSNYGQTRMILPKSNYGGEIETPKVFNSYGAAPAEPLPVQPSYGSETRMILPKSNYGSHIETPKVFNSYGAAPAEPLPVPSNYGQTRMILPKSNYGGEIETPKVFNSYGAAPAEPLPVQPSYGSQTRVILPKSNYGGEIESKTFVEKSSY